MSVGITIAVLLNHAPETSDWDWGHSRNSSTIQNDDKIDHLASPEQGDQSPKIKLEDSEPVFKLEDTHTWFSPASLAKVGPLWRGPSDSPRREKVKEETPELDLECLTDSGSQTPELLSEDSVKPDPDTRTASHIVKKEETEEQNHSLVSELKLSSQTYTRNANDISLPTSRTPRRRPHHRRKSWPCQTHQCKEIFTNKRLYERHLSRDHRYKSTVCPLCNKKLGRKDYMTDHVRSKRHRTALDARNTSK